ncbi:hypothetical protein DPMN_127014 [Dreissena polymorpha]|uniref:Uncharacterized protein n=1 Tax=Dreissena polymorpha TaxID=45954 RepID=A0A9D4JV17_DREPO|nr:hypothetical protein DPMN_127014 [Dreissena polymorpha]
MSNVEILMGNGSIELFKIFRDTSIGILDLRTEFCSSLASKILHTLDKLTWLFLSGTYTGRCDLKLPTSFQCFSLHKGACPSEWLYSMLIELSSLDHAVKCEMLEFVLQSSEDACGDDSDKNISALRSDILSRDISIIEILVKNGSSKLFEIFRDTSIDVIDLKTADCATLASKILHTLKNLTKLHLWGTYTGRCDLKLSDSLQSISLNDVDCSSEWLCSLLMTIASLDHLVKCELWNVVFQSREEAHGYDLQKNKSDMREQMLSRDMSKIAILVTDRCMEMFEIFREISIATLELRTANGALLRSDILDMLKKLTKLYLWGTFTGRCYFKLPASLQYISLQKGECLYEWLCSLLITLSSLNHHVKCELWDVVLLSNANALGEESKRHVSDLRSEIVSFDMSNIEILVKYGSPE